MWPRATAGCVCPAVHLPAIASATGPIDCPPRPLGLAHDSTDMTAAFPAQDDIRIAVIGLGYVGLPLAAAFGRRYPTVGFDIDAQRIAQLRARDRKSVVEGQEVSVRVDLGGRRIIKNKNHHYNE